MTALLIGPPEREQLQQLRTLAAEHPVDMVKLMQRLKTRGGKRLHMRQMAQQTIYLPVDYAVTLSIETGHPCGTARHLSVSIEKDGRLPLPEAVWMIAEELGFVGALEGCALWLEKLALRGEAVNVWQPVVTQASGSA